MPENSTPGIGPKDHDELLDLATIVGLNAVHADELADIERRLAGAPIGVRVEFHQQVRATREAMARVSAATAAEAPPTVRDHLLAAIHAEPSSTETTRPVSTTAPAETAVPPSEPAGDGAVAPVTELRPRRRQTVYLAAATVAAVAIGAVGWVIGVSTGSSDDPARSPAEQVFAAGDARSASGSVGGGEATVTFSDSANAGVLVMRDVPPPKAGTVYQMWLRHPSGVVSAGTMSDKDVSPTTTAVLTDLDDATALAFTVEPPGGSPQPTGAIVAELPLG
ncbi:anti-sigma factor [Gordonia soli]|uniref:Regulator of SigK n=1 Tax=Gordonia soli NBRC 108243 TaxID=1223545 RepID=M0QKT9_9ACTN|nr:anti-sigma factor [Gordonia soli]GAC69260.1 anti-sigma-K factor RskA [Gordonia soli NBRC 108243]